MYSQCQLIGKGRYWLMNTENNSTILDEMEIFFEPEKSKEKELKMSSYLLNMDEDGVVGRFESEISANEVGRTSKFTYLVINEESGLEQLTVPHLNKLRKNLGMKQEAKKEDALNGVWDAMELVEFKEPVKVPKKKKAKGEKRGPSRREKILDLFKENDGVISKEQIAERLGIKNPAACMTGLGNAAKTKAPVLTTWDKETKTYKLSGHDKD